MPQTSTQPTCTHLEKILLLAHGKTSLISLLLAFTFLGLQGQIVHSLPTCSGDDVFTQVIWDNPAGPGEYNWHPGDFSLLASNIQGGGQNIQFTVTGAVAALSPLSGDATPQVSSLLAPIDLLAFYVSPSYGPNDSIVLTMDFIPAIPATAALDIYHVNKSGGGGDQVAISATFQGGAPLYPILTSPANPSWVQIGPGVADAVAASTAGTRDQVGVNFNGTGLIDQIRVVWKECTTCNSNTHGFGIGGLDFCVRPELLPVALSAFEAEALPGGGAKIGWSIASADEGSIYAVERSQDAEKWTEVAREGYTPAPSEHSLTDPDAPAGYNLYRLRMVDGNGKTTFSDAREVYLAQQNDEIVVFPNPSREKLTVQLRVVPAEPALVFDGFGRLKGRLALESAENTIDLAGYDPGLYFIRIGGGNRTVHQTVKQEADSA